MALPTLVLRTLEDHLKNYVAVTGELTWDDPPITRNPSKIRVTEL